MASSLVLTTMRRFKQALIQREYATTSAMAREWLKVENRLRDKISLLSQDMTDAQKAGQSPKPWQMQRYQELLVQLDFEMARYVPVASQIITAGQADVATLGLQSAQQSIWASYTGAGRIAANFNMLPTEAVQNMAGALGNGSPLDTLLKDAYSNAAEGIASQLTMGTALGWNPNKTAKAAMQGLDAGLGRMTTIARTEQMRVFREANRQQMEESGVVEYYVRLVTHSPRTCVACLAAEGEKYTTQEALRDHPNGRCVAICKLDGVPLPEFEKGVDWFNRQSPEQQRKQMGAAKYAAYKDGKFDFGQLAVRTKDRTWGDGVRPATLAELGIARGAAPLKDLVGGAGRKAQAADTLSLSSRYDSIEDGNIWTLENPAFESPLDIRTVHDEYTERSLMLGDVTVRPASDDEMKAFARMINEMPNEIKPLIGKDQRRQRLSLQIGPDNAAQSGGSIVMIGPSDLAGKSATSLGFAQSGTANTAQHEALHVFTRNLGSSEQRKWWAVAKENDFGFTHSWRERDLLGNGNEDITMMLSGYSNDHARWAKNLLDNEIGEMGQGYGRRMTMDEASDKVSKFITFAKSIMGLDL